LHQGHLRFHAADTHHNCSDQPGVLGPRIVSNISPLLVRLRRVQSCSASNDQVCAVLRSAATLVCRELRVFHRLTFVLPDSSPALQIQAVPVLAQTVPFIRAQFTRFQSLSFMLPIYRPIRQLTSMLQFGAVVARSVERLEHGAVSISFLQISMPGRRQQPEIF
jgi:hypothetical protein